MQQMHDCRLQCTEQNRGPGIVHIHAVTVFVCDRPVTRLAIDIFSFAHILTKVSLVLK